MKNILQKYSNLFGYLLGTLIGISLVYIIKPVETDILDRWYFAVEFFSITFLTTSIGGYVATRNINQLIGNVFTGLVGIFSMWNLWLFDIWMESLIVIVLMISLYMTGYVGILQKKYNWNIHRVELFRLEMNEVNGFIFTLLHIDSSTPYDLDSALFGIDIAEHHFHLDVFYKHYIIIDNSGYEETETEN